MTLYGGSSLVRSLHNLIRPEFGDAGELTDPVTSKLSNSKQNYRTLNVPKTIVARDFVFCSVLLNNLPIRSCTKKHPSKNGGMFFDWLALTPVVRR